MNAKEALKLSIDMGDFIASSYLEDLTDAEMMHRPTEKANHIKWQLGHLITAENGMINQISDGQMPDLPDGFAEKYTKETATNDDEAAFDSKEELMKQYQTQRAGTLKALESMNDADFDKETGVEYAPTVASMFALQGSHYLMHAGQWAVIRRQLGREPIF